MMGIGKTNAVAGGVDKGCVGLNIFTQLEEPDIKDGIWVQTANKYKKIIVDNRILDDTSNNGLWTEVSTLPYRMDQDSAVVYDGEIHILGYDSDSPKFHYKYDGTTWTEVSTLPHDKFNDGCALVYNGEIHILGGWLQNSTNKPVVYTYHYKYDGETWTEVSTLPYKFSDGSAVVYNGEIHILGGWNGNNSNYYNYTFHYKYDGETWTEVSTLPYKFSNGSAVVYNGEIHILGGLNASDSSYYGYTYHYKYDGETWTEVSTLPYKFSNGSAVVYNGEIHILGGKTSDAKHYKYDGTTWTEVSTLPYKFSNGSAVVYNGEIHILNEYHYKFGLPTKLYSPCTLILQRNKEDSGTYKVAIADTSIIEGENNRFVSAFDDVYFFGESQFDFSLPMYYGDGTQWIKFKN